MERSEVEKIVGKFPDGMPDDLIKKIGSQLEKINTLEESNKTLTTKNTDLEKENNTLKSDGEHHKGEAKKAFEARDQAKSERRDAENELKKLQDSGGYQKLYEEEKKARETAETKVTELENSAKLTERKSVISRALEDAQANPKYLNFLIDQLDVESLTIKDGKIDGFPEKLNKLKEDYPEMFGKDTVHGTGHIDGKVPEPPTIKVGDQQVKLSYFTREQVDKMTESEVKENLDSVNWSQQQWIKTGENKS